MFEEYTSRYDKSDGRIELKIIHTNSVVDIMEMLCEKRRLPEHTARLAMLCALFHDIGRFEQLKQYNTFLDHESCDHAGLSCSVLKENHILESLTESDQNKILTAISNHNRYKIDPEITEAAKAKTPAVHGLGGDSSTSGIDETAILDAQECLELCKLIRDADKCDIFRVFAMDDMNDVVGASESKIAQETITPAVRQAILEHRCVDKLIRRTYLDFWVSFLGFFFDLNYPETVAAAKSQGYYRMPFDRTAFADPETSRQVAEILAEIECYIDGIAKSAENKSGGTGQSANHISGGIIASANRNSGGIGQSGDVKSSETIPDPLRNFFALHKDMALAFSGGTDSAYLLYAAVKCGCNVRAYYVSTPFQPQFELDDAKKLAEELNAPMTVIPFNVLALKEVKANPSDRCYYCKNGIFSLILETAAKDGHREIMDGTNASDDAGDRPGMRALRELQVLSPLRECGITKKALREYSRNAGLFTWNKPAYACLATRIPTNIPIEKEMLQKIEAAESFLSAMGFSDFRVRVIPEAAASVKTDSENSGSLQSGYNAAAYTAKLQITGSQLPLLLEKREEILEFLNSEFSSVLLDLNTRTSSVVL